MVGFIPTLASMEVAWRLANRGKGLPVNKQATMGKEVNMQ